MMSLILSNTELKCRYIKTMALFLSQFCVAWGIPQSIGEVFSLFSIFYWITEWSCFGSRQHRCKLHTHWLVHLTKTLYVGDTGDFLLFHLSIIKLFSIDEQIGLSLKWSVSNLNTMPLWMSSLNDISFFIQIWTTTLFIFFDFNRREIELRKWPIVDGLWPTKPKNEGMVAFWNWRYEIRLRRRRK